MGSDRAAVTRGAAQAQRRQASRTRPGNPDRGIIFVLKTPIPWQMLPKEMGCGSGMTCWRRLEEWHEAGVWDRLRKTLLDRLGRADEIDWQRASLDSASVAAPGGAKRPLRIQRISRQIGIEAPRYGRPAGCPTRGDSHRR